MGSNINTFSNIHKDLNKNIWVHSDSEYDDITIHMIDKDGKETISVNGKEMSRADFDAMEKEDGFREKHIRIKKLNGSSENNAFIMTDSDEHAEIHIDSDNDGGQMIFIQEDSKDSPLIIIDGKVSKKGAMNKLSSSEIASINVYKGAKAKKKFGKKGKDGVIEIKTKNN